MRAAIPSWNPLRHTEFATIRLRLLKVAGRVIESATRGAAMTAFQEQ
jgi:hypothetical protein